MDVGYDRNWIKNRNSGLGQNSGYAKILGETNFRTREIPRNGSKAKDGERERDTPGTRGWSRLRDRMLAVSKNRMKISFYW